MSVSANCAYYRAKACTTWGSQQEQNERGRHDPSDPPARRLTHLRDAARKRAAYRRTLHELRGVPSHLAEDLGIYPGDAKRLAREAVYG